MERETIMGGYEIDTGKRKLPVAFIEVTYCRKAGAARRSSTIKMQRAPPTSITGSLQSDQLSSSAETYNNIVTRSVSEFS